MSVLRRILLAVSVALLTIPFAGATLIQFDDRSESPFLIFDGVPVPCAEGCGTGPTQFGVLFTEAFVQFVVLEPGTTIVSDIIMVVVTPSPSQNLTFVSLDFLSDLEGVPPSYTPRPFDQIITETGDFQTLYSDTVGNRSLIIQFASDVPEPATLALLGIGLAGIGFTRRRARLT
jgi:hypothetical protein